MAPPTKPSHVSVCTYWKPTESFDNLHILWGLSKEVISVGNPRGLHTVGLLYEADGHAAEFSALDAVPVCIYWLVYGNCAQGGSCSTGSHSTGLIQFSLLQKYFPGHQRPRANFIWLPIDPFTKAFLKMKREARTGVTHMLVNVDPKNRFHTWVYVCIYTLTGYHLL